MFIQKAVENLLADRDIKRAAHAELRATCEQVLEEIRYNLKEGSQMPDPALKMPLVQMVNTDDKIVPLNLGP